MDLPVIFEDDYLLAIDKPAGLVVNRRENVKEETVQDWAENRIRPKDDQLTAEAVRGSDFYERGGIVHRIDKDTSGILLIAKNEDVFSKLQQLFKEKQIEKIYLALVHGKVSADLKEINLPVGRLPWNRRKFGVLPQGRPAVTLIFPVNYYRDKDYKDYTLIKAQPKTGRIHQIRIHLKNANHPLVSDSLYSGRKTLLADLNICPRMFLHAQQISFRHPVSGQKIGIESKMPEVLKTCLEGLKRI